MSPRHLLLVLASLALAPATAIAQDFAKFDLGDGEAIEYRLLLPEATAAAEGEAAQKGPKSLVLLLADGWGTKDEAQNAEKRLGKPLHEAGFAVLIPVARDSEIGFHDDGGDEVLRLLTHVEKKIGLEPGRCTLALIGRSGPGGFRLMVQNSPRFGAVVGVATAVRDVRPLRRVWNKPIWLRAGRDGNQASKSVGQVAQRMMKVTGCQVDYALVPGDDGFRVPMSELVTWLRAKETVFTKPRPVSFEAKDGLQVTGEFYGDRRPDRPIALLCHQARFSRGSYRPIAPKLVQLGWNCLAIDQRSGNEARGVANETAARAKKAGKSMQYLDAKPDILAALDWLQSEEYRGTVLLWGSSYSAALALIVATEREEVGAVIAFSPGEYLGADGLVGAACKKLEVPTLIVAPENERKQAEALFAQVGATEKKLAVDASFQHGSKTLWEGEGAKKAWAIVKSFLEETGL